MKWLVGFNARNTQLILFHWSINTDANNVNMDGSVFKEKPSFEKLGLSSTFGPD